MSELTIGDNFLHKIRSQISDSLLICAEKGDLNEILNITESGIDVNMVRGLHDFTPLHYAASRGHIAVISHLLKLGANIDSKNVDGESALHLAVFGGFILAVEQLLDCGANVNFKNNDGETPLFYASRKGMTSLVRVLFQYGADASIEDDLGDTAYDRALNTETKNMFKLLENIKIAGEHGVVSVRPSTPHAPAGNDTNFHLNFGNFPYGILCSIFEYLEVKEIARSGCVNSKWNRVSQDKQLWSKVAGGLSRWEYALRQKMGFEPTATTTLLSFTNQKSLSKASSFVKVSSFRKENNVMKSDNGNDNDLELVFA